MNSFPPDPPPRGSPLGFDEVIAVFVAFGSIGAILFWVISQRPAGSSFSILPAPLVTPSPTVSILPSVAPAPLPPGITPTPQAIAPAPVVPPLVAPLIVAPSPSVTASPIAPPTVSVTPAPSPGVSSFPDVPTTFWAGSFIGELTRRNILAGYPDGTFRPDQPVTRTEFAAMLQKAFGFENSSQALPFEDVPSSYWAAPTIANVVQSGFMRGYPDNQFRPDQQIPKEQAIVALATGLDLPIPANPRQVLSVYQDQDTLPQYAVDRAAAATQAGLVVNYPDREFITPKQITTRAEAAALIYQGLVKSQKASPLQSQYIVPSQP
jgi:S-layer homology domain